MAAIVFVVLAILPLAIASGDGVYHSASILSYDYAQMLDSFKLFIYPEMNATRQLDFRAQNASFQGTPEELWFGSLAASKFVTQDPEEADLFVLPVSIASIWRDRGSRRTSNTLKGYIQQVRDRFPFWQRALGADHVYISCQDFQSDASRNVLELKKNAIQIACFPLVAAQDFFRHKDILMPHLGSSEDSAPDRRPHLLHFSSQNLAIPASIASVWRQDPEIVTGDLKSFARSSKFCLSGGGDRAAILDAIRLGCVPVIIFDEGFHDLPLQDVIDWHKFSLVISASDIATLRQSLLDIVHQPGKYSRVAANIRSAAKHLQWNQPPQPRDAFHMVLYQLWRRRHATRYVDRRVA